MIDFNVWNFNVKKRERERNTGKNPIDLCKLLIHGYHSKKTILHQPYLFRLACLAPFKILFLRSLPAVLASLSML